MSLSRRIIQPTFCSAKAGWVRLWAGFVLVLLSASLNAAVSPGTPSATSTVPLFSVPGGIYTNAVTVRLTGSSNAGVVRYTLDGSDPVASSPKFGAPIEITETTLLRARVFDAATTNHPTVAQTYILLESDLSGFSSNLPLVVIHSFGQPVSMDKLPVSARFIAPQDGRSKLAGAADFDGRGQLNIRGHTSLRYPKHSFQFKSRDGADNPLKTSILGLPQESDWILYAPYPDKTLMRDVLAYELSNQIGRYAARTRFVEVFLNETGGRLSARNYLGVYVLEEKIKRGEHRVAIEKLTPDDNDEPRISGGYVFKKDHHDDVDVPDRLLGTRDRPAPVGPPRFRTAGGGQFFYVEPKPDEITPRQRTWLRRHLNTFEQALYGDGFRDPKTGYAAYIDIDSFIDHHWLVELTKNIDGFRFSTFYHKDRGGKINMGPLWDWNLSLGNANGKQGWVPEGWYWPQLDDQQYSWFRRLFEDPDFEQRYIDRWGGLRRQQFSVARLHARIDYYADLLNEAQARNFRKWRILGRNVSPNTFVGRTFTEEVTWMKQWIQERVEWIDTQFTLAPSFSQKPGPVVRGSELALRAPVGRIYYTVDGTDPRARGGAVSPAARAYGAAIQLDQSAVVFCRALHGKRWSYPSTASFVVGK